MARRRRPKSSSDTLLDSLPQIVGLVFLAVYFVPGAKEFLGNLFALILALGGLLLIGLIGRAIYRRVNTADESSTAISTSPNPSKTPVAATTPPKPAVPAWSLDLLRSLEWKRFEELVCAYIRELELSARTTRAGADGGVDIEVLDPATDQIAMIVQCKAWNAYQVGVKPVRELFGVMAAKKIPQCAFFTTGTYTAEALAFGREHDVDLVDGEELLSRFSQLRLSQSLELLEYATRGDYTTPTCPSCDVKMILRTASKGRGEGDDFWGCRNYPRCRQTFKCTDATAFST